jgi:hypothetical protein
MLKDCQQFGDILHIILWKGRHEVNLSKLAVGNLALNLVNYSVLHIDIGLILVGMIANISDRKDTIFLSNNNEFSLEIMFFGEKGSLFCCENTRKPTKTHEIVTFAYSVIDYCPFSACG